MILWSNVHKIYTSYYLMLIKENSTAGSIRFLSYFIWRHLRSVRLYVIIISIYFPVLRCFSFVILSFTVFFFHFHDLLVPFLSTFISVPKVTDPKEKKVNKDQLLLRLELKKKEVVIKTSNKKLGEGFMTVCYW